MADQQSIHRRSMTGSLEYIADRLEAAVEDGTEQTLRTVASQVVFSLRMLASEAESEPSKPGARVLNTFTGEWVPVPEEDLTEAMAAIEGSASTGRFEDFLAEINTADGTRLLDLGQQVAIAYFEHGAITKAHFEEVNAAWFERMRHLVPPTTEATDE